MKNEVIALTNSTRYAVVIGSVSDTCVMKDPEVPIFPCIMLSALPCVLPCIMSHAYSIVPYRIELRKVSPPWNSHHASGEGQLTACLHSPDA